eukprot:3906152-Rhodomonas_salina.2
MPRPVLECYFPSSVRCGDRTCREVPRARFPTKCGGADVVHGGGPARISTWVPTSAIILCDLRYPHTQRTPLSACHQLRYPPIGTPVCRSSRTCTNSAIGLLACYATFGTTTAYGATAIALHSSYAMPGAKPAHRAWWDQGRASVLISLLTDACEAGGIPWPQEGRGPAAHLCPYALPTLCPSIALHASYVESEYRPTRFLCGGGSAQLRALASVLPEVKLEGESVQEERVLVLVTSPVLVSCIDGISGSESRVCASGCVLRLRCPSQPEAPQADQIRVTGSGNLSCA